MRPAAPSVHRWRRYEWARESSSVDGVSSACRNHAHLRSIARNATPSSLVCNGNPIKHVVPFVFGAHQHRRASVAGERAMRASGGVGRGHEGLWWGRPGSRCQDLRSRSVSSATRDARWSVGVRSPVKRPAVVTDSPRHRLVGPARLIARCGDGLRALVDLHTPAAATSLDSAR